ncbi:MAG TPA: site-2 protease family protein, partial [Gammaproteobacteria bacterium]|nr:site-2 protease family protein [Gammaproteobacteria bacterium]
MKKVFLWVLISALFNAQIASPVTSTDLRKRAAWAAHLWVLLAARIFVHETGHAIAAKAIGAKVESINLGWSETEPYITVCDTFFLRNLIPLAGYCKVSSREPLSPGNQLFFASAGVLAEVAVTLGIYGSSKIFG